MNDKKSFIRNYRRRARLTQAELAQKIGVSRQTVSNWESGLYNPTDENVIQMSKVFNLPPDALFAEYLDEKQTGHLDNKPSSVVRLYENKNELLNETPSGLVTVNYNDPTSLFALRINDDKMDGANLPKGSLAIIRTKGIIRNGMMALLSVARDIPKIAYVYIEDDTLTVKYSTKKSPEEKYDLKKTDVDFIGRVIGYMGDL